MYKKIVFAVVLLTTLALFSCKNENMTDSGEESLSIVMNMGDADFRMEKHIDMVDLETPFGTKKEECSSEETNGKKEKRQKRHEKRTEMMKEKLGLSDEQVEQMKLAKEAMKECSESSKNEMKTLINDVFESANAQRDVIISSMKNGEINEDEAKELLKTLKSTVKESIKNNEEISALKSELKVCHEEMRSKIEAILTAEQLEMMKQKKGKQKKGKRRRNK